MFHNSRNFPGVGPWAAAYLARLLPPENHPVFNPIPRSLNVPNAAVRTTACASGCLWVVNVNIAAAAEPAGRPPSVGAGS